ncbi:MAG: DUF2341 domain-containing protein [Myxococcaceae bacterium]|nr:DUF2341 domain-containing protein [Myxococcaceae bacterium]
MRAAVVSLVLVSSSAWAQWLPGFAQRQAVDVSHATALSDFQVLVVAGTAGARPGCPDVRFTSADGVTVLPHWLESGCGTPATRFWVRVPGVTATTRLWLYSGSVTAASTSSPAAVNLFYDTFDTDPEDGGRWSDLFRLDGSRANELVWQPDAGELWLTTAAAQLGAGATFATIDPAWEDGWAVSFRFRVGGGTGADGLSLGFFHAGNDGRGNSHALNQRGYAVEVDGFMGPLETTANHLAVVTTLDADAGEDFEHHAQYDTPVTEDDEWHGLLVEFHQGRLTVSLDDAGVVLDHTRTWSKANRKLVFGAGTGGQTNVHRIDDVVLRKVVRPAPMVTVGAVEGFDAGSVAPDGGVTNAGPFELALVTTELSVEAGETSSLITVSVRNASHLEVPVPADLPITFTSTSARGGFLQKFGDPADQPFTVTLAGGGSSTGVYYRDFAVGVQTLTATAPGLMPANAPLEVKAAPPQGCGCGSVVSLLPALMVAVLRRRASRSESPSAR